MISFDSLTASDELANPDPDCDQEQEAGFGCLQTHRGGLPLRRLAVDGRITGLLYRLTVAQEFINTSLEPLEATYIFPLPARAGITRFQLRVAERLIEGVLKERSVARADYDQAIRAGRRAAIAEEERPEVFTVRAGNIQPGETVQVELELSGPLAFADQQATFRFPLVVAPRYIPGLALDGPSVGQGTAWDTDAVPDASRITPPILLPGQPNPIHLSLRLELDPAGLPWSDLRASLHELRLSQTAAALQVVELRPGVERLDRDFILRFRVGGDDIASSLNFYRHPDGEWIGLLTVVPPADSAALAMPPDQDEHLDMPAFLRRAVAPIGSFIGSSSGLYRLRSPKMMRYELADSTPAPAQQSTAPDSLPAWFMALEKALTAPDSDPAQQAHAIRAALAELTKLGAGVKELVEQGWGLVRQLESDNRYLAKLCSRLARWWLRRLRKWLESSHALANHRRFWWK